MSPVGFEDKVAFVWKVADKLRGTFKPHEPRPFTIEGLTRPRNAPKCLSCNEILDLRRSKNHVREGTW